jgi:hypothetical protein
MRFPVPWLYENKYVSCCDCFHTDILSIAIIYSCSLARRYEAHSHKESKDVTRSLSSQGPVYQGQEGGAQANNTHNI